MAGTFRGPLAPMHLARGNRYSHNGPAAMGPLLPMGVSGTPAPVFGNAFRPTPVQHGYLDNQYGNGFLTSFSTVSIATDSRPLADFTTISQNLNVEEMAFVRNLGSAQLPSDKGMNQYMQFPHQAMSMSRLNQLLTEYRAEYNKMHGSDILDKWKYVGICKFMQPRTASYQGRSDYVLTLVVRGRTRMANYWAATGRKLEKGFRLYIVLTRVPIVSPVTGMVRAKSARVGGRGAAAGAPDTVSLLEAGEWAWRFVPYISEDGSPPPRDIYVTYDSVGRPYVGDYRQIGFLWDVHGINAKAPDIDHKSMAQAFCYPNGPSPTEYRDKNQVGIDAIEIMLNNTI